MLQPCLPEESVESVIIINWPEVKQLGRDMTLLLLLGHLAGGWGLLVFSCSDVDQEEVDSSLDRRPASEAEKDPRRAGDPKLGVLSLPGDAGECHPRADLGSALCRSREDPRCSICNQLHLLSQVRA